MTPFCTIATFASEAEAGVARDALLEAEIDAVVDGARVRVRNEDAFRASQVLEALSVRETEQPDELPEVVPCVCPVCEPIRNARGAMFLFVATVCVGLALAFGVGEGAFFAILAAAVYFLIADRWHCPECGASWN